jgi:hypothetical protein
MTKDEQSADEFATLVRTRTGLAPRQLTCPREKTDMTPCLARDGHLALSYRYDRSMCIGCEHGLETLLNKEKTLHGKS